MSIIFSMKSRVDVEFMKGRLTACSNLSWEDVIKAIAHCRNYVILFTKITIVLTFTQK